MKKEYLETNDVNIFFEAMNQDKGIHCETESGNECRIDKLHCEPGVKGKCIVKVRISCTQCENQEKLNNLPPAKFRLYRRIFENGDYVYQQGGYILICAGVEREHYAVHAVLDKDGELQEPEGEQKYWDMMYDDRLCTEEEKKRIDDALFNRRKVFDASRNKILDGIVLEKEKINWAHLQETTPQILKFGLQFVTINKETGEVDIPSSLSSEQINHVLVKCADILRARAKK